MSTDDAPLVAATGGIEGRLELIGFVPGCEGAPIAYLRAEGTTVERAREALAAAADGRVRAIRENGDDGHLEWTLSGETLLGSLAERGAHVLEATAEEGRGRYVVEMASDGDVRALLDRIKQAFPETYLDAKRRHNRPIDRIDGIPESAVEDLTDRQREALETAYLSGYFEWPRESTAEEVAGSLDITAPTLHAHLRKAERTLFDSLFG
ncbi:MAG: bacterio-opsin activator domain-containing protein [Salinigranum sp.]